MGSEMVTIMGQTEWTKISVRRDLSDDLRMLRIQMQADLGRELTFTDLIRLLMDNYEDKSRETYKDDNEG